MWGMLGRRCHFSIVIKTSLQMGLPRKLGETICTIVHFLDVAGSQFVRLKCMGANVTLTYNGFTNTMTVNSAWSNACQHLHEATLKSCAAPPALPRPFPTLKPRKHLMSSLAAPSPVREKPGHRG